MNLDDDLRAALDQGDEPPARDSFDDVRARAGRLRRRRSARRMGAFAATVGVVVVGVVAGTAGDGKTVSVGDGTITTAPEPTVPDPTSTVSAVAPATAATSTTTATSAGPPTTASSSTTSSTVAAQERGSLDSATMGIRSACRRFYGYDVDLNESTGTSLLPEAELASRCDQPDVEFRSDCYAERPATFTPGEGGCAVLGGYLAVYFTDPPAGDGTADDQFRFPVGDSVWWIYPESD